MAESPKSPKLPPRPSPPVAPNRQTNGIVGLVAAGPLRKEATMDTASPKPKRTPPPRWPFAYTLLLSALCLERLSFYSIKTVLFPYLADSIGLGQRLANVVLALCFQIMLVAPIIGALMADAKLGKYRTLLWWLPIYLLGQILLCLGPMLPMPSFFHPHVELLALFLLGLGCGSVKAVLAAYGADQVWPQYVPQLACFFALFYALEQLALVVTVLLVPTLKTLILWPMPVDKPLLPVFSFSLTLLWLAVATLVFWNNKFRQVLPPSGQNVFGRSWHTIQHALYNKWRQRRNKLITVKSSSRRESGPSPKHFLDHFLDDHNCERDRQCDFGRRQVCGQEKFLDELKSVFRMLLVMSPFPLFWAMNLLMRSIWDAQAQSVDPRLPLVGALLPPDQLCLLPPLAVLLLIPFFYLFLYPSAKLSQCLSLNTYLRRMGAGMFLCALACALSASSQFLLNISDSPPIQPPTSSALLKVFNIFPTDCSLSVAKLNDQPSAEILIPAAVGDSENVSIRTLAGVPTFQLTPGEIAAGFADWTFRFSGASCSGHRMSKVRIGIVVGKLNLVVVGPQGILWTAVGLPRAVPSSGQSSLGILMLLPCNSLDSAVPECASGPEDDVLLRALTPFSSGLSLCPSPQSTAIFGDGNSTSPSSASPDQSSDSPNSIDNSSTTTASAMCTVGWKATDPSSAQLFVFPPRGDNLGMGKASLYPVKLVQDGNYTMTATLPISAPPDVPSPTNDSTSSSMPSPMANQSATVPTLPQQQIVLYGSGGVFMLVVALDGSPLAGQNDSFTRPSATLTLLSLSGPNTLSLLWLLPQNMIMATAEILLCITALEFCYVQAPNSLKATMLGVWYSTIALGNSLFSQLVSFQPFPDSFRQLLFISLVTFNLAALFAVLARFFFKYRDNLNGLSAIDVQGPKRKEAQQARNGLAEKIEGTLRSSMARLPKSKKVIRL